MNVFVPTAGHPDAALVCDTDSTADEMALGSRASPLNETPHSRLSVNHLAAAAGAGAIVSAIVAAGVLYFAPLTRSIDPRMQTIGRDIDDMKAQLLASAGKIRDLETGAVAGGEAVDAVRKDMQSQSTALAGLQKELGTLTSTVQSERQDRAGLVAPALLGVAVVQLRTMLDRGLPFDWELVNLWGIAGRRSEAATELGRLAPMAAEGVPTAREILAQLQALSRRAASGTSILRSGLGTMEWLLGTNMAGANPAAGSDQAVLRRAIADVQQGDYVAASRELAGGSADLASSAEAVRDALNQRATAQSAMDALMALSKRGLAAQARAPM